MNISLLLEKLDENYPYASCSLKYSNAFELLVATILSAQCRDERVNKVTDKLFEKYKKIEDYADADLKEFEKDIYSIGIYKNKAKNIIETANIIINEFNGTVPDKREELVKLKGVGRKTANVVLGDYFNVPAITVDTHVKRVSKRLGLTNESTPVKVEKDLMDMLPKEKWVKYNHQIIKHGRDLCKSRSPKCEECFLNDICRYYKK